MIPEEARLGAFTLTTGERDGRTCTVTDAWDDLVRVTSMIDKVIMHCTLTAESIGDSLYEADVSSDISDSAINAP